jgi:N-acetylglucosaminyl-diphospho-decaprenol L-rhamnosyltransferase
VTPDASILIVTYQCRDAARECLASVYEHAGGDVELEVIVLDNASGDGTAEMIRSEFPQVRLLALDENLGFAAGVNRAADEARGEYLLLLNPDTVVHEGAVANLVTFARNRPEHGLYGGRTLRPNGELDPGSCWGQPTLWSLFCFATMLTTAFKGTRLFDPESLGGWQRDSVREVGIVTGCLLLVSRALWEELGGFDLRFFMYGEDADLSLRARQRGLRPTITPDSVVTHEVGVSSSTRPDKLMLLFRGKATLFRKHWPAGKRELALGLLLTGVGLRALVSRLTGSAEGGKAGAWRPIWRARRDWLAGYPPVPERVFAGNGAPPARVPARH